MSNDTVRHSGLVTSLSWIPTEAIEGAQRLAFDSGVTHYDPPPPSEHLDVEALREADRFRFANVLRAWIDVDGSGRIVDCGYAGGGVMGSTLVNLAGVKHRFQAVELPDIQREPERGDGWVRFMQTTGGRTGVPAPRRVRRRPFIQWQAPLVWTTLSLTIHADGRCETKLVGASRFPRHWVYDGEGQLSHKSGLTDFKDWYRVSFGKHTPWGDQESEALVTAVESALETAMSARMMQGGTKRRIDKFPKGSVLVKEGEPGSHVLLILDGVVRIDRGGERLAEYGPGALLGERAHLEGGVRTSTMVAVTPCRIALFEAEHLDRAELEQLSEGHRRETRRDTERVRAHFCGTRGSTPAPGAAFVRYGGHTSCVALSHTDSASGRPTLLLDAGTGLRALGPLLGDQPFRGTILLSHFHWDHVQGIPFFDRGDREDAQVAVLVPPQEDGADGETVLARMMSPPLFPIWPKDLRGRWTFGDLPAAAFTDGFALEGFTIMARDVPHKGGRTVGYRVSDSHSTIVYIPDHCPTSLGPGDHGWGEVHPHAVELARGADLLVHDAQLRADEVAAQASFGHAAADYAVELARKAGVALVALFHHHPNRTDPEIDAIAAGLTTDELPVLGAAEGTAITL